MQSIRFGAFTPPQQAQLDTLTGGKTLRQAVLDSIQPMTPKEEKEFRMLLRNGKEFFKSGMTGNTPAEFEKGLLELLDEMKADPLDQYLQQSANPAEAREALLGASSLNIAMVEVSKLWKKPITDKAFDALRQMTEILKTTLKF